MNTFLDAPEIWKCTGGFAIRVFRTTGEIKTLPKGRIEICCNPVNLVILESKINSGWYEIKDSTGKQVFLMIADPGLKEIYEYLS